jgi:hypothetical protein
MTTKKSSTVKSGGERHRAPERLQPRTRREEELTEYVLEHADEIKAARARCDARAVAISPYYTPAEKAHAEAKARIAESRVTDISSFRAAHPRIQITKREWVECSYTAHVAGVLGIVPGMYELDAQGVVTSFNPARGNKGREAVGLNFFTEVAPTLRDYLPHYLEMYARDDVYAHHYVESDDAEIQLIQIDRAVIAIVSEKGGV